MTTPAMRMLKATQKASLKTKGDAQGMIATKVTAFVLFVKLHGVRRKGMKYWPL
jgi:hypothetical protein